MAFDRSRRATDPRERAEAAFKAATTRKPEIAPSDAAPPARGSAVPGVRETVSLRIEKAVLEHFQKDGPGWQDRINAALKTAAGL